MLIVWLVNSVKKKMTKSQEAMEYAWLVVVVIPTVLLDKCACLTKTMAKVDAKMVVISTMIAPWAQLVSMATVPIPVSTLRNVVPTQCAKLSHMRPLVNAQRAPESSIHLMWHVFLQTWICLQSVALETVIVHLV